MTDETGSIINHTSQGPHDAPVRLTEYISFGLTTDRFVTIELGEGDDALAVVVNSTAARQIAAQLEAMADTADGKAVQ